MPQLNISKKEWKIAYKLLNKTPDGTKLPYSMVNRNGQLVPRQAFQDNPKPYEIEHSFIKVNGEIYGIAQGKTRDSVIGFGSIDKVKYAENREGELLLMKISNNSRSNEAGIMMDLSQSFGADMRIDKSKHYTAVIFLGTNLKQYLVENKNIDDETRLDIAIKLCWQMHCLHEGLSSRSGKAYAHMDLKPDNIVINQNKEIHIIDYGLSETQPKEIGRVKTGAFPYMPYQHQTQNLTKEQIDIISLKRTLFMPSSFYCPKGWISAISKKVLPSSVLTEDILTQFDLHPYINTHAIEGDEPDYQSNSIFAVTLSALLISAKLNLQIDNEQVKDDIMIANTIVGLYFNGKGSEIQGTLDKPEKIKLIGALQATGKINKLATFGSDIDFCEALDSANTHHACLALVYLKDMGLQEYYSSVCMSEEIAIAVLNIKKHTENNIDIASSIKVILRDDNGCYAKAINYLSEKNLFDCYSSVIKDKKLAVSISNGQLNEVIDSMSQNPSFDNRNYKTLINNPEVVKAHHNCCDIGLKPIHIASVVSSKEKSKALNILSDKGITNTNDISAFFYNSRMPSLIIKLHRLDAFEAYHRLLDPTERNFVDNLSRILDFNFSDKITGEMLSNEHMIKALAALERSTAKSKPNALFTLFELDLVNKESSEIFEKSFDLYRLINLLHNNDLDKYISVCFNRRLETYFLIKILKKASSQDEMSFIMKNSTLFEQGKQFIGSIEELYAYKAIEDAGVVLDFGNLSGSQVLAINQLIRNLPNEVDEERIELILNDRFFVGSINATNKTYHINAALIASSWNEHSSIMKQLASAENSLLAKMISASTNEEQGIEFFNLFKALNKLKQKKGDLEERNKVGAIDTCSHLINELEDYLKDFFNPKKSTKHDYGAFIQLKDACQAAIFESRGELEKHRGIIGALDTFLTILASLLVFYPFVYLYQKHNNVNYSFFSTKTKKIIDNLEKSLEECYESNNSCQGSIDCHR